MSDIKLKVEGMTCQHCVMSVKKAIEAVPGTEDVVVDLDTGSVEFFLEDEKNLEQVKKNIQKAGYRV